MHDTKLARPIVELKRVRKTFGRSVAVRDVSLKLVAGQTVGLVGENGSGKSTLARILFGEIPADSGVIAYAGIDQRACSTKEALRSGIRLLPQLPELCGDLSVRENVFLGQELRLRLAGIDVLMSGRMDEQCRLLLDRLGAPEISPLVPASQLSGGQRRTVSLARALLQEATLLIFDEPTASLGVRQQELFLDAVRREKEAGKAVLLITHHSSEVLQVCDRVIGMKSGVIVADHPQSDLTAADLNSLMGSQ